MATVNKDFKIKNGLIVEGTTGTINGFDILTKDLADQQYITNLVGGSGTSAATANTLVLRDGSANFAANVITADLVGDVTGTVSDISNHDTDDLSEGNNNLYFTDDRAKDAAGAALTGGTQTNITVSYDNLNKTFSFEVADGISQSNTDALAEGITNLYFTNARAQTAVSAGDGLSYDGLGQFSVNVGNGLEFALDGSLQIDDSIVATDSDVSSAISSHNASSGVHGVTGDVVGTSDVQTLSNKVLGNSVTLGANIDAQGYTITDLAAPEQATDAATKAYVDSVAEGLHIHASAAAATTANVDLATELEAGDVIDGVTLVAGDRVLVKNQSAPAQNGVYVVQASGAAVRASDYDSPAEVQGGDFIFINGGTVNADTGWVQTSELVSVIGTDPIYFTQFSGAGTFLAGYGLYLDGNTFNVDSNVIANLEYVGNAVSDHSALTTGVHGVTGDVVGTTDSQTLENKTLGNSVVLGASLDAANAYTVKNLIEPALSTDAATKGYVDTEISGISNTVAGLTTDDIAEGDNLYFTNARVEAAITNIDTDDVAEGAINQYFTDARAKDSAADLLTGATLTNITITGTGAGLTITAENGVADSTTDDLDEGTTNLYFTDARAVSALEAVTPNFVEVDINSLATQVAATTGVVSTAGDVTAYSWPKASYRSAEFLVKVAYSTHTEISKVILTMDSSDNIAITEYAIVGTNGNASAITADISGSDARLRVTTLNNNSTVTVVGTLLV